MDQGCHRPEDFRDHRGRVVRARDSGQAFPAYVAVVAGLLFLAFIYFTVGQATVLRNGAQTAADAAALGAAQDARDQLRAGWLESIGEPDMWAQFLQGKKYVEEQSCQRAAELASVNGAELSPVDCHSRDLIFTVTVRTEKSVGPDGQQATASASAVVEPLCTFAPPTPTEDPTPGTHTEPGPSSSPTGEPEEQPEPISGLSCGGEAWDIDLEDLVLPDVDDLFHVRLTSDDE
ncbi:MULTISPECIES: pilus assembly protein TadG-related protein [Streptomyces]|uniref:Pilus assembly protein TadG-related protein n=2 Tax=Streptomyces TaxID=1883 RepID=A0ABU4KEF1_9ACTN|nr:pilus assembly protein TadG-related protein [Streptomyces roseolus]MDX2296158.1 pilus assembly protein TadG-related protein [Streptomyces roseolus]